MFHSQSVEPCSQDYVICCIIVRDSCCCSNFIQCIVCCDLGLQNYIILKTYLSCIKKKSHSDLFFVTEGFYFEHFTFLKHTDLPIRKFYFENLTHLVPPVSHCQGLGLLPLCTTACMCENEGERSGVINSSLRTYDLRWNYIIFSKL